MSSSAKGLVDEAFVALRCEDDAFAKWRRFISDPKHSPEAMESQTGVSAAKVRSAARLFATGGNAAIYYGLGVTEHSQGSTAVMAIANLAMATGNLGRRGVGVNPLRGQNNVQGSCDMGSFPHELPGYRHVSDDAVRGSFEQAWGVQLAGRARPAHSEHVRGRARWRIQGPVHRRRGYRPVRSEYPARHRGAIGDGMRRRAGPVSQRDRQVRACVSARFEFPRKGRHVYQCRAPHLARAASDAAEERLCRLGNHAVAIKRNGLPDELQPSIRDHGRDRPI